MSVIFHTNANSPALCGDMIVSVPGPNVNTELKLPVHPHGIVIPKHIIPKFIPVQLRRKVFMINDRMVVGAAGSVYYIQRFIHDLREAFHNGSDFTYKDIRGHLDGYSSISKTCEEVLKQISAILLVEATDRRCSLTVGHREQFSSVNYGNVISLGAGSSSIRDQILRLDQKYRYGVSVPTNAKQVFPEFETIFRNMTLLANVYWTEFMSPDIVFNGWGGAYELIFQDANRNFRFLEGYSIFLRVFDADRVSDGIRPWNILKYERRSDVSVVTTVLPDRLEFFGARDILATDEPLRISVGGEGFTMNSKVHVSIIAVGKGTKFLAPMIQIDGLDPLAEAKQTVFTDFDESGRLRVYFHAKHEDWLKQQAMDLYDRNAHLFPDE